MKCKVYIQGREVAELAQDHDGNSMLTYHADTAPDDFVSLTMPVRTESYLWDDQLPPVLQMNLPEGYLLQVVDARPAPRFRGEAPEPRAGMRSGHMPGARNTPFDSLLNPDGTMKAAEELRALFAAAQVDLAAPIVTTCGSGVTASVVALALARLGRRDVPVYDGSWTEWGGRKDAEAET